MAYSRLQNILSNFNLESTALLKGQHSWLSGLLSCVVWWLDTNVSEGRAAFIYRITTHKSTNPIFISVKTSNFAKLKSFEICVTGNSAFVIVVVIIIIIIKSRDSSVGIALGYGLNDRGSRVRFPAGAMNFSLHHRVQNGSGAHPASSPMGTRGSFP
jgi:hypothetical protein